MTSACLPARLAAWVAISELPVLHVAHQLISSAAYKSDDPNKVQLRASRSKYKTEATRTGTAVQQQGCCPFPGKILCAQLGVVVWEGHWRRCGVAPYGCCRAWPEKIVGSHRPRTALQEECGNVKLWMVPGCGARMRSGVSLGAGKWCSSRGRHERRRWWRRCGTGGRAP